MLNNPLYHPVYVAAVLCLAIAASEWLVRHTRLRHLGTALLVIVVTAVLANMGVIPSASNAPPLYTGVFSYMAPAGIFLLLLEVNLGQLRRAGLPMLLMFAVGSAATLAGVFLGLAAMDAAARVPMYAAVGGMFAGTYTGGAINFNAVALHFDVMRDGNLFAGAVAVDNIMTAIWMVCTLALPRALWLLRPARKISAESASTSAGEDEDARTLSPLGLALLLGMTSAALWLSDLGAAWLGTVGIAVPSILILTTIALVLAQLPVTRRLTGSRLVGMFFVYLFLAVIGAYCDLGAVNEIGELGLVLFGFVTVLILVHGVLTFGVGALFRVDWDVVAVASQANIGGSTSALALARSLNRRDLLLPAILVGSLGNALGTYLGFLVAGTLAH